MASTLVVGNSTLELDKDGYLRDHNSWSIEAAHALAKSLEIELSAAHWEILEVMRTFYQRRGVAPVMRILVKLIERELGSHKGNSLYLLQLFPESPARVAALIAGLPRPTNCL